MQLAVSIIAVNHLPLADMLGKCDPYVTLSFFEQKFNTAVHRNCLDSTFDEIFIVFVHGNNAALAKNEVKYEDFQKAVSCISLQSPCIVTFSPLRLESPLLKIYLSRSGRA